MDISIFASDLDGTFVTPENQITPINERAVSTAHARGIPFVFATGRPARWLEVLQPLTAIGPWVIASNGAITMRLGTGEITRARTMDPEVVHQVVRDLRERLPHSLFAVEYLDGWGAEDGYPQGHGDRADVIASVDGLLAHSEIVKILIRDSSLPTDLLYEAVRPIVADRLTTTFSFISSEGMLEMSARGVSKALALAELMNDLCLDPGGLVAFGDMPNDRAMLDLATRGFIMSDAHDSLRSAGFSLAGDCRDSGVGRTVLDLLGTEY